MLQLDAMAAPGTPRRFQVELCNVDRGLYTSLDVRLAKHPSETDRFLFARVLAYCFLYEEDDRAVLAFSKGGLSSPEEPALSRTSLDGRLLLWCDIGTPSLERVHKACKAAPRVVIFTHHEPKLLLDELAKGHVHRKSELEVYALAPAFLDDLARTFPDRTEQFELTLTEGRLYVSHGGTSVQGEIPRVELSD
jgi:uncharacterized protein YaeQ